MRHIANPFMIYKVKILTAVFFLLLAGGCERQSEIQPSGKVIKVGVIGPFSGADRAKGEDGIEGIKAAMKLQPLLSNGAKLELVIEDDQNQPELTVSALNRLANEEQVSAVLLLSTSASALEIRSVANETKIPVLAVLATHPDVTRDSDYVSQFCFDDIFQGSVAALFAMDELLIEKAAVFTNPDSHHSSILATEFIRKFQTVGGMVTDTVLVSDGQNYNEKLELLRDKGTRLLYLPVNAQEVIAIEKAARGIDWHPAIMASDGLVATIINDYSENISLLEGIYAIDFFSHDDKTLKSVSYLRKLKKIYQSQAKNKVTTYTVLGTEGYMILSDAFNRCVNPEDRLCINRMLRNTKNFEGLAGKVSILENGKANRPLIVNTVRDGQLEFIVKVY